MRLNPTTQPSYPTLNPLLPRGSFCPPERADSMWNWNYPEEGEEIKGWKWRPVQLLLLLPFKSLWHHATLQVDPSEHLN